MVRWSVGDRVRLLDGREFWILEKVKRPRRWPWRLLIKNRTVYVGKSDDGGIDEFTAYDIAELTFSDYVTARCIGICITGNEIGVPSYKIAYAHPDCEEHGHRSKQ